MTASDSATGLMSPPETGTGPAAIAASLRAALTAGSGEDTLVETSAFEPVGTADAAPPAMTLLARASVSGGRTGELVLLAGGPLARRLVTASNGTTPLAALWQGLRGVIATGQGKVEWNAAPPLEGSTTDLAMGLAGIFLEDVPLLQTRGRVTSPQQHAGEFQLRVSAALVDDRGAAATAGITPEAKPVFPSLDAAGAGATSGTLGLMGDIEVELVARLGEVDMKLEEVLALSPGSVLELNRTVEDPVDLIVNGKHIGRAEVVVVGEKFALRIQEIGEKRSRRVA